MPNWRLYAGRVAMSALLAAERDGEAQAKGYGMTLREAGFSQTRVESLVGPQSMIVAVK